MNTQTPSVHKLTDLQRLKISHVSNSQHPPENQVLAFCISEGADICQPISSHWSHHQQWRYEKSSLSLCSSAVLSHTHLWSFIAFLSLFLSLSLSLSLPVAGSNKGLTGRAWRSWLLDGKGESHSWAGQASSLAKVMSCVHWDRGGGVGGVLIWDKCFFLSLRPPGLVREKPPGLLIKCRVWARRRGGDYELANKLKYCPSGVCLCMWARLTAPEAFTPAASSAIFELLWPRLLELSCETCRHIHNSIPFWWEGSLLKPSVAQITHKRPHIKVSRKLGTQSCNQCLPKWKKKGYFRLNLRPPPRLTTQQSENPAYSLHKSVQAACFLIKDHCQGVLIWLTMTKYVHQQTDILTK